MFDYIWFILIALLVAKLHNLQVMRKMKLSSVTSHALVTVFWDVEGEILLDITPYGQTINSDL